ncbi:hypothetical protein [Nocardia asteroides]|uniref:hypothetical protein n=1 Tax=Nocardia asteroides TaxID=1824 RepID=UPI003401378C
MTIAGGVMENLDPNTLTQPRLIPALTTPELPIFAIPHALTILGCLTAGRQL